MSDETTSQQPQKRDNTSCPTCGAYVPSPQRGAVAVHKFCQKCNSFYARKIDGSWQKRCRRCKEVHTWGGKIEDGPFRGLKNSKDRLQPRCKKCEERMKNDREARRSESETTSVELESMMPTPVSAETVYCRVCGETKPLSEFYRDNSRSKGVSSMCKTCDKIDQTDRRRMITARAKAYEQLPESTQAPIVMIPQTPQFLPALNGGFALNHVIEWDRRNDGSVDVILNAIEWNKQGYPQQRTMVLPREDADRFIAAIHTVMHIPDPRIAELQNQLDEAIAKATDGIIDRGQLNRIRTERDDLFNEVQSLRAELQAIEDDRSAWQALAGQHENENVKLRKRLEALHALASGDV